MSAAAPTTGPPGCCTPTATPPPTAPRSSTPTTWRQTWWWPWAATTFGCCVIWASRKTGSACCGRAIHARAPIPSTSTTPTTATTATSRTFSPSSRPPCPGCTPGSTNDSRKTDRLDAAFEGGPGFPAAAGLGGPGTGGHRLHLPVLHGARALAAGKEHQDIAGEPPDRVLPEQPAGAAENPTTPAGFVEHWRAVASGDGDRALPARRASAGSPAGGRGGPGVRGAGTVRRR